MQGATVQGTAVRVNTTLHMYSQMMMRSTHTAMSLVVSREGSIWIWSRKKKLRNNFKSVYACILKDKYVTTLCTYLMKLYLPLKESSCIKPIKLHTGHITQVRALKHLTCSDNQHKIEGKRNQIVQWNPFIADTIGDQHFVPYNKVSLTQGLLVYFQ